MYEEITMRYLLSTMKRSLQTIVQLVLTTLKKKMLLHLRMDKQLLNNT